MIIWSAKYSYPPNSYTQKIYIYKISQMQLDHYVVSQDVILSTIYNQMQCQHHNL